MKIAISLGSFLLGKALQEQLQNEHGIAQVSLLNPAGDMDPIDADFIITDVYTINQKRPDCLTKAKTVLLDYGLSEDNIAQLIITNRIDGLMTTDTDLRLLMKAFHAILKGQIWIDNSRIKAVVNFADSSKETGLAGNLSNKEREIVILIAQGLTNKEIASKIFISEQTVKAHLNSIFKKLNLSRRTQLVPLGIKLNTDLTG